MKRQDLYNYIKEEIVEALSEGEVVIPTSTGTSAGATTDQKNTAKVASAKGDTIKYIKKGQVDEMDLDEMANIASKIQIQDPAKLALAKEIYTSGRTKSLLDALETAGEEGMTQKDLGAALGLKNDSELNSVINNLRAAGVLAPKREKTAKPEKSTPEEPTPEEPTLELPTLSPDEEPVDNYNKEDEEELSSEEPTSVDDKEVEKIIGKTYADLTPEEEKTYGMYRQAIINKAKILNNKKASKDDKAKAKAAVDKYKSNADLKKLFNKKGIDLIKFISGELNK
jgi:hypothetical protein